MQIVLFKRNNKSDGPRYVPSKIMCFALLQDVEECPIANSLRKKDNLHALSVMPYCACPRDTEFCSGVARQRHKTVQSFFWCVLVCRRLAATEEMVWFDM